MTEHFGDLFKEYLQVQGVTPAPLAQRTGLPKETIINWRKGRVRQPQRWQDIALAASALELKVDAVTRLLQAAGYPPVVELIETVEGKSDLLFLQSWIEELTARDRFLQMLPPRPVNFTNRVREMANLMARLQPGQVVALCASGGMGKTALAIELLYRLIDDGRLYVRFPDGVIFYSFYGRADTASAFEHILKSYEPQAQHFSAQAVTRLLSRKKALLVLDGTEEAVDLPAVLAAVGPSAVLLTSRRRQDAPGRFLDLSPFTPADAKRLLNTWSPQQIDDNRAAENICELVGYLPLAVRLVGRYLYVTGETATGYLAWLKETPLQALDPDGVQRREASVPRLLARSLEQVGPLSKLVLGVIGLLALAPFSSAAIAQALPDIAVVPLLNQLVAYGLLQRVGSQYEVTHALVHTYGRYQLPPDDAALARLAAFYESLAIEQTKLGQAGYTQLDQVRAHFAPVLTHCLARQQWTAVQKLVVIINQYLGDQGHWLENIKILDLGLQAVRAAANTQYEVQFMARKGLALIRLGHIEQAIQLSELALTLAKETGDTEGMGRCLNNLGIAYNTSGQLDQAIACHQQALSIRREAGNKKGEAHDLGNLGTAYFEAGQIEQAVTYHQQALAIAQELDDSQFLTASWLNNLGSIYRIQGRVTEARDLLQQALALAHEVGYLTAASNALNNLGIIEMEAGQLEKAQGFYEQALSANRQMGYRLGTGICLHNLGELHMMMDDHLLARQYLLQATAVFNALQSPFALESQKLLADLQSPA